MSTGAAKQTKLESLLESCVSTAVGFIISLIAWHIVGPWFGYEVTWAANLGITGIFTVISVARQYVFRRFFNAGIHRSIRRFVARIYSKGELKCN